MTWQDSLEDWKWKYKSWLSGGETIIGAGEDLPPTDVNLREVRDYSGTATLEEVGATLNTPNTKFDRVTIASNGDNYATPPVVDLGRFVSIRRGKVKPTENIWLPEATMYQNTAIIGAANSGKTEGYIIPGIKGAIDAGISNIVIDVKGGELIDKLGNYARQKGFKVVYWSALPQEVHRSHSINLLDNVSSIQDAKILAKALYGSTDNLGENQLYANRDINWIAQWIILLKHLLGNRATLKHVYKIAENPLQILSQLLTRCQDRSIYSAIASQIRMMNNSDSGDTSFTWAIQDAIDFFAWSNFERVTQHSDFLLRDLQHQPVLLVIGAELAGRDISQKISAALIDVLMTVFYERWTQNNHQQGILFWLDEFPRLQDSIDIDSFTSVARSAKGGIVIAAQSIEQIHAEYRDRLMENFNTVILCRGVSHNAAEWFNRRLGGERPVNRYSRRYHQPNPEDEYPWLRTRSQRERYERWRESIPILASREIQYPVGDRYVAVVQVRNASRKAFLIDYQREIQPKSIWQPIPRLNWQDVNPIPTRQPSYRTSSQLNWRDC